MSSRRTTGLCALDGEALVIEARSAPEVDLKVPAPVTPHQAREAVAGYRGSSDGVFSRCFVCGPAREDAFGVFAGEVEGRQLVASPWTPPSWTADAAGAVLPEFVWARPPLRWPTTSPANSSATTAVLPGRRMTI